MNNLVITNKGQELMAGLIAGTNHAAFTEIVTSDREYSETDLAELESIDGVKQTSEISGITRTDNNVVQIISSIENADLTEGYYIKIVGIYAVDDTENKILYAVTIEPENPIYMPAFGGKTESSVDFIFNVKVSNSDNVNLIVDPSGVPSRAEFNTVKVEIKTASDAAAEAKSTAESAQATATAAQTAATEAKTAATAAKSAVTAIQTQITEGGGVPASTLGGKTADEFADAEHTHTTANITDMPTSLPANGGNAATVGGAAVMTTAALGLHRMASGTDEPTSATCPPGCWYGQYE